VTITLSNYQSSRHKCYDPPGKINIMNRKIAFSPEEDVHV